MRRLMVAAAILATLAVPAAAQTRLPRTTPAERQVKELNRSIQQEQRVLQREQQYQIDNNQLRQRLDRRQNLSNPSPPARIGTCPAGSIGC
jgi:regulator of sirC expression with transglutaminase-like and TPR domain